MKNFFNYLKTNSLISIPLLIFYLTCFIICSFSIFRILTNNNSNYYYSSATHFDVNFNTPDTGISFIDNVQKFILLRNNKDFELAISKPGKDFEYFFKINEDLNIYIKYSLFNSGDLDIYFTGNDYNSIRICTIKYNMYNQNKGKPIIEFIQIAHPYYYEKLNKHLYIIFDHLNSVFSQRLKEFNFKTEKL